MYISRKMSSAFVLFDPNVQAVVSPNQPGFGCGQDFRFSSSDMKKKLEWLQCGVYLGSQAILLNHLACK